LTIQRPNTIIICSSTTSQSLDVVGAQSVVTSSDI